MIAPDSSSCPKIRVFNVKFSPNLGDGLLSECLEAELINQGANQDSWSIDLAGRTVFDAGSRGRSTLMSILNSLPPTLRAAAVRLPLAVQARRKWQPHYAASLAGADAVVIGGGNLIADLDLNFPTKIALAIEEAAKRGLPVFIYGCGVSAGFSRRGKAMLTSAFANPAVRKVYLRDQKSKVIWDETFGAQTGHLAAIVRDPGLLASICYGVRQLPVAEAGKIIGVNIISPIAVQYHSADAPSAEHLEQWYLDVIAALIDRGYRAAVFTNGSPEDRACAAKLRRYLEGRHSPQSLLFPVADTPAELAHVIASLGALVAFRMHAIIAAYAFGIPFLALAWDEKLRSFLRSVDREDWLCSVKQTAPQQAIAAIEQAIKRGISDAERDAVQDDARSGVAALFAEISGTLGKE